MEAFHANPWFKTLPKEDAEALFNLSVPVALAAGERLFSEGDSFDGDRGSFFGLAAGLIKLSILRPNGKEVILSVIEPGNWFGAGPVLLRSARGHNAVAMENSRVRAIRAADFETLMNHTGFSSAVARQMAQRLRLAYEAMGATALLATRERVIKLLAVLSRGGLTVSDEERRTINTSQDALAMMLGMSRPTLNKELNVLAELGLITLKYGRIELKEGFELAEAGPQS